MHFDGSNDYVDISSSSFLPFGKESFSINFWFKPVNLTSTWSTLLETRPANDNTGIWFGSYQGRLHIWQGDSTWDGPTALLDNKWYNTTIIGNGSADGSRNIKVFLNNTQEGNVGTLDYNLTNPRLFLGLFWGMGYCFPGLISDVRVYNTALTVEEISRIYAETKDSYLVYE